MYGEGKQKGGETMEREKLNKYFVLVDYNDDWRYFSKPFYKYINERYSGGETITITTGPKKILNFIEELIKINPEYLNYIREIELRYWVGNEFRGSGGDASKIVVNREFAQKISLEGYFKWVDKGWGDYTADLKYDLSKEE